MSLNISKLVNVIDCLHLTGLLVVVISQTTILGLNHRAYETMKDPDGNFDALLKEIQTFSELQQVIVTVTAVCCFYYPFRVFTLMSHISYFDPIKSFLCSVFRIAPGLLMFISILSIFMITWA
jgi:hypothetical protein